MLFLHLEQEVMKSAFLLSLDLESACPRIIKLVSNNMTEVSQHQTLSLLPYLLAPLPVSLRHLLHLLHPTFTFLNRNPTHTHTNCQRKSNLCGVRRMLKIPSYKLKPNNTPPSPASERLSVLSQCFERVEVV